MESQTALLKEAIQLIAKRKIIVMAASNHNRKAVRCMNRLADLSRQLAEVDDLHKGNDISRDYWLKETDLIHKQIRRVISGFNIDEIMGAEYVKKKVTGSCTIDYNPEEDPDIILIKKVCGIG